MAFYDFAKCWKSIGPRAFWSIEKSLSKYLIKPVEFQDFLSQNRKMSPKMIKKSIRFFSKSHRAIRHLAKPYKTCRLLRVLGGQKPTIFGLAPLSGGDLFFSWRRPIMLTIMQNKIVFCMIGRPVFSGLFFSLAIYHAFLGGARTANQQSNSRALRCDSFPPP